MMEFKPDKIISIFYAMPIVYFFNNITLNIVLSKRGVPVV